MSIAYEKYAHPAAPASVPSDGSSATPPATTPAVRMVPTGLGARGMVLCIGLDEATAAASGTSLRDIAAALRRRVAELTPEAEIYAAVAMAPEGVGGRDLDVVRRSLQDTVSLTETSDRLETRPTAVSHRRPAGTRRAPRDRAGYGSGLVIDLGRRAVRADDDPIRLTHLEFELLRYLVTRQGTTVSRQELLEGLYGETDGTAPADRTIDVHVLRLRRKLDRYADVVRTVRGSGYRIDPHADVLVRPLPYTAEHDHDAGAVATRMS